MRVEMCPFYYLLEPIMADRPGTNPLALCDIGVDVAHGRSEQDTTQQDDDIESHLSNPFSIIDKPLIKVINITTVRRM
jgi:hypothetical protein